MLRIDFGPAPRRLCDGLSRRDFLRASLIGLGALGIAPGLAAEPSPFARDKAIVLLFLSGGPSQYETFDPKPDGVDSFTSITGHLRTRLPGVRFSSYFPKMAERADRLTVLRSLVAKTASHDQAVKNILTGGLNDPQAREGAPITRPSMGSVYARACGNTHPKTAMPTYAFLPPTFAKVEGLNIGTVNPGVETAQSGSEAGPLGPVFRPFNPEAGNGWKDLTTSVVPEARLDGRRHLLQQLDQARRVLDRQSTDGSFDQVGRQAFDLLHSGAIRKALDLSLEAPRVRETYDTSRYPIYGWSEKNHWIKDGPSTGFPLGKQMLLARRLVEAGSRFVTVVHSNWDMHGGNAVWGMKDGMDVFGPPLGHGFAGPACGAKLVDDLKLARPVWKSEAFVPTGYGSAPDSRYFDRAGMTDAGGGSSSPVVVDGRVYQFFYYPRGPVGLDRVYGKYKDEDDLKAKARELFPKREIQQQWVVNHFRTQADEILVCMDAANGQTLWKATMPQRGNNYQTHKHRGLFPVALIAGGVVYQPGTTGRLYAFDAVTGKLLWEYPDTKPEPYITKKGGIDCHAPSPVLVNDVVVYAAGKGVVGVDAKSGKEKWERSLATRGSLLSWKGTSKTLVIATDRNNEKKEDFAVAIDPADGKVVWREKIDFVTGYTFPLLAGDVLVGYSLKLEKVKPGENDGLAVVHAYKVTEKGLTKAWTTSPLAPVIDTVGLAVHGEHVYVSTAAEAFCLSLAKGETVASVKDVGGARTQAAFVADGRLFIQPEGRHGKQSFFMLDADPKRFAVLGKKDEEAEVNHSVDAGRQWLPPHSWTTAYANQPINYPLVDGRLFVRGLDAVYCYDLRKSR